MGVDIAHLSSFPEQNPNPVIEIDFIEDIIEYANPAALSTFPDIKEKKCAHPIFAQVIPNFKTRKSFNCRATVNEKTYDQNVFFFEGTNLARIYSNDITQELKDKFDLSRLATFPEQNPNPVIEGNKNTGELTYINPAAKKRFPDLLEKKSDHPLIGEVIKKVHEGKDFNCEIQIDDHYFEQKVFFIPGSELIRIYSTDITEQKNINKKLGRLASFPERNPTPIMEFDLNGNMTYVNPAFTEIFGSFYSLSKDHPVLNAFYDHYPRIIKGELTSFEAELHINGQFYLQRGSWLKENEVIRIFTFDVTEQKTQEEIIKEKNKDITDSINYAKKIQGALLPEISSFKKLFDDSFILYKPKDIISGDFYWFTMVKDYRIFACADCTGHGVPGALMSMIGINLLSHIVIDEQMSNPGDALHVLDDRIRTSLRQDLDNEQKDGMDIALCAFNPNDNLLHYSGANRPLLILRNNEIIETTASKFAIGGPKNPLKKFQFHEIQLQKGDLLYLCSDGFADQFGGPKGKKMTKKRMLEVIKENHKLPMNEQMIRLDDYFYSWKGELEQVDDVCVIGIRVK